MNPAAVAIIAKLHGDAALDAFERWNERLGICLYDGVMRIEDAETVALSDLRAYVARLGPHGELFYGWCDGVRKS